MKTYLDASATFSQKLYPRFSKITVFGEMTSTTNPIERVNLNLKTISGQGYLPIEKAFVKIRDLKHHYIQQRENRAINNNLNRRKSSVTDREEKLQDILINYDALTTAEQMETVIQTAFEIGTLRAVNENRPIEF